MVASLRTERDVERNLLAPLFRDTLGYPEGELQWAGTPTSEPRTEAGLVALYKGAPVITVAARKPTEPVRGGLTQVDSFAFALHTPYSVVTNGRQFVLRGYYSFNSRINVVDEPVEELASHGWTKVHNLIGYRSISSAFKQKANEVADPNPEKIQDYRRFFRRIHNEIRDRDKLDPTAAFDELSKLLFLKAAEDEWQHARSRPVLTPEKISEWEALGHGKALVLINEWFQAATAELFPDVFDDQPRINLSPGTLKAVLELMRPFHVKNGDVDVKGRAFEEFLPSQLRGKGLGQFFTPRPVVNFMADMAAVSIQDVVVDFSCGSGGFLIKAFEQMQKYVAQLPAATLKQMGTTREEVLDGIRSGQLFGVDAEPRAARTAKMNMLMWGDGRRVVRGNALDTKDFSGKLYKPEEYAELNPHSGCTLILANPPFGSKEKDSDILKRYALASSRERRNAVRSEVLFVEKGLKLLQPEGKMLIVLPQGLVSSANNARVRDYIHSQAEIKAIISLPTHTFVQSGVPTVNSCILYVQKFTTEKQELYTSKTAGHSKEDIRTLLRNDPDFDYPIFMATAEYIGYEPSGRMIVAPGEKTDLDLILEDFAKQPDIAKKNVDVFEFAEKHYGERPFQRKDQPIRGTVRGLKTSQVILLSKTDERLDPPYYFLREQAGKLLSSLVPLAGSIKKKRSSFSPTSDAELDADYQSLTVSNDGMVTLNQRIKGEDFKRMRRVRAGDIVYNPMRVNIGSIGVVPKSLDGGLVSPDYVVFQSKKVDPEFLVMLLRTPFYRMYIDIVSTGSIRDRLYFENLEMIRIPEVSPAEQAAMCAMDPRAEEAKSLAEIARVKTETVDRLNQYVRSSDENHDLPKAFKALASRWHRETGMLSSMTKKMNHPAYQKIIAMGPAVVPLILAEMKRRPAYWFKALETITGSSPIPKGLKVDLETATAMWLALDLERGYTQE